MKDLFEIDFLLLLFAVLCFAVSFSSFLQLCSLVPHSVSAVLCCDRGDEPFTCHSEHDHEPQSIFHSPHVIKLIVLKFFLFSTMAWASNLLSVWDSCSLLGLFLVSVLNVLHGCVHMTLWAFETWGMRSAWAYEQPLNLLYDVIARKINGHLFVHKLWCAPPDKMTIDNQVWHRDHVRGSDTRATGMCLSQFVNYSTWRNLGQRFKMWVVY